MKKFSDLGIKPGNYMVGDKIQIERILNRRIVVLKYRIEDSRYNKNRSGKCLYMQIELEGTKRVVFTGSDILLDMIQKVPDDDFPFETVIIKEGKHFEFS